MKLTNVSDVHVNNKVNIKNKPISIPFVEGDRITIPDNEVWKVDVFYNNSSTSMRKVMSLNGIDIYVNRTTASNISLTLVAGDNIRGSDISSYITGMVIDEDYKGGK